MARRALGAQRQTTLAHTGVPASRQDRNAPRASSSTSSGWGVLSALAAASKGVVKGGAALQDVCTCAHAEAGLRAAMLACGKKADGSGELVQALLLQARPAFTVSLRVFVSQLL